MPVAQWGAQEILSPYGKRLRLLPRRTMSMAAGAPVDLSDLYDRPLDAAVLREATDRLMDRITELLEAIRDEPAPSERFDPRALGIPEIGSPLRHEDIGRARRSRRPGRDERHTA